MHWYCPVAHDSWFLVLFFGGAFCAFWSGFELGKEMGWRRPRDAKGRFTK